ncbi:MAG: glucoamylase family protein [Marinifilaceae bacterium]
MKKRELRKSGNLRRMQISLLVLVMLTCISCVSLAPSQTAINHEDSRPFLTDNSKQWNRLSKQDQAFLDLVERKAFDYFWEGFDPNTGLIADKTRGRRTSVATSGFGLSAYCVGVARGWVSREEVYQRVLTILNSYYKDPERKDDFCVEGIHGFFYHFVNVDTGKRHGRCEVSTIDTAILMAGILHVMEFFEGTEVAELANKIYLNAQWDKFLNEKRAVTGGWRPEEGIIAEYRGYNEYLLVYLLGMGSPSHPIPAQSWDVYFSGNGAEFIKPYKDIDAFLTPHGLMQPHAYLYQFPACWFDFRGKKDKYVNHWQNSVNALKANKRYTNNWGAAHGYTEELWGWTACAGRDGYIGFSKPYNGTLAPSAVVASIPFLPKESLRAARYMYKEYGDKIWGKYGFVDSFNPYQNWFDDGFLGIDKGNEVLMLENFRNETIWRLFMKNRYVKKGMEKAQMKNV